MSLGLKSDRTTHVVCFFLTASLIIPLANLGAAQGRRVIHPEMTHLRSGDQREWSDFPLEAHGPRLEVTFEAAANETAATIGLRRIDVKHGWEVKLNGERLGRFFSDENDMEEVWELEPGALRDGTNVLTVEATSDRVDDVKIGEIWFDPRSRAEIFNESQVRLVCRDDSGEKLPCRYTILNERGTLAATGATSNETLAVRSGVVYCAAGEATIGLAAGRYTIRCGRGFEYSLEEQTVEAAKGERLERSFELRRVVDTAGMVACDPHIHTFEVSRHGDASLAERMITLAGEGIELAVATDHNVFIDYTPYLKEMKLAQWITPVIGNEVTTPYGHFNVFPAEADAPLPDHATGNWDQLLDEIYGTPNIRVAILNHPRDIHSGFTPFGPENMISAVGQRTDGRTLRANAMELVNSAALQSDPMVLFHDWLTLLNRGTRITAVGSSDSHEVSRKIVGQGRTYVFVDDSNPGEIDVDAAVESFVQGRALVSMGLLTQLTVNDSARAGETVAVAGEQFDVEVTVQGPEWTESRQVELYANGQRIRIHRSDDAEARRAGIKQEQRWQIEAPPHDVHLVALARGPGVGGLHWPIAKSYQPTSPVWEPYVFGASNAIRLDCDGDGKWTSAKEYAAEAVNAAAGDFARLLESLNRFDKPTATFAAHAWSEAGHSLSDESATRLLSQAEPHVQDGFAEYRRSQRASLDAEHSQ